MCRPTRRSMPPAHACDACKRRKVKCNGARPCANCQISEIHCSYGPNPAKRVRGPLSPFREATASTSHVGAVPGEIQYVHPAPRTPETTDPGQQRQPLVDAQQQNSPGSVRTASSGRFLDVGSSDTPIGPNFLYEPPRIHSGFVASLPSLLTSRTISDIAHEYIDFFVRHLFPNTPIAHEPTLRGAVALLKPDGFANYADLPFASDISQIACMRRFSLITALCACVASVMPTPIGVRSMALSKLFLSASRAMLMYYEEYDLEHPDSTSLTIRMWHSAAMQNTTGRVGASYQAHAGAAYIALRLKLHDEQALRLHSKTESRLLRASFWLLYLADQTSIAFETRPPALNELYFDGNFTLLEDGGEDEPLLDPTKNVNQGGLEDRLWVGFHLKRRIWCEAADLLRGLKTFCRKRRQGTMQSAEEALERTRLSESYLLFTSIADQLPQWLINLDVGMDSYDDDVWKYQKDCFWAQRSNIMTVLHCMRLVILQKSLEYGVLDVIGLGDSPVSWALRKTEIARDFLHELQITPFPCFKAQGEAAVSLPHPRDVCYCR